MPKLSRREFLSAAGAFALLPRGPLSAAPGFTPLNAQVGDIQLLPEAYGTTSIWGFEGRAPGPEIRVAQGARVQRKLQNALPQATSVHWHGIRIANEMDGVAGLTQPAVEPKANFDYDFVAPDAGTYWYHAHNRSTEQVARGLYGALIVEEADKPDVDREEVLIFDDWLIDPQTSQIAGDFDSPHAQSHAGRMGNYVTTNGTYNLTVPAKQNERFRLRLINASNARTFPLQLHGMEGWIIALDGMPLKEPLEVTEPIILGSAQRADLIVDVVTEPGEAAHILHLDRQESFSQVAFEVDGRASESRRGKPAPLPSNRHEVVDLAQATRLNLKMEGGAMGGLRSATLNGEPKSMGELVEAGRFWAFNGSADGMDNEPLAKLSRGEHVQLRVTNDTAFPHAIHLHGMHFHEMGENGVLGPLRDTALIERGAAREIAFVADNPGQWLLHCHMLSHAASGMMTRIVVS